MSGESPGHPRTAGDSGQKGGSPTEAPERQSSSLPAVDTPGSGLRTIQSRLEEVELKIRLRELERPWLSPKVWGPAALVAGALIGALGSGLVAAVQGVMGFALEQRRFEWALIQEALKPQNQTDRASALRFLVDIGVVARVDEEGLSRYVDDPRLLPTYGRLDTDLKVNDQDGPLVTVGKSQGYAYSWSSLEATACVLHSPSGAGGIARGGASTISPDHPWYPKDYQPTVLTLACTDGARWGIDSVIVTTLPPPPK
jgi:hypothetical protein